MTQKTINLGTADKGNGDPLRVAFGKVNDNFTELYTALGLNVGGLNLGAFEFTGSVMTTTDSTPVVIDQATTVTSNLSVGGDIVPQTANGGDLGSSTLPWRSLYVSNNTIYIGGTALSVDSQGNLLVGGQSIADVGTAAWASITGKPTFATVATSGAYADLTGRPTSFNSLVTGAYSVNLESGGVLRANVQGIVSDNQLAVEGSTLISIQTLDGPFLQLFNQGATKEINLVAWDGESLNYPTWSFDTDRTLTLPNDSSIKSATNIDIIIDTPDSSTFNWRFGADGALTFPDDTVQSTAYIPGDIQSEGNINIDINLSDSTLRRWQFGEDGSLTLPSGGTILNSSGQPYVNGVSSINTSVTTSIFTDASGDYTYGTLSYDYAVNGVSNSFSIEYSRPLVGGNVDINVGNTIVNGDLTLSGDIKSDSNINIDINLADSTLRRWQFGEDGNLTLPQGGNISEGGGLTGAIRLTPSGGANANQALLIYPTAGAPEGDHLHLTAGGGTTELYLGNDYHYVKLVDGGNVEVKATTANFSATAAWTFGTDGSLASDDEFIIKAPNGIPTSVYNYSGNGGWNSPPYTNLATTTNNLGTGLTVNVSTAVGGYIDINAITINTPGTGYKTGDLITITNENSLTGTFVVGVAGTNSWTFGTSGSLTLPIGVSIDSSVSALYPKIIADSGKLFSVQGQGSTGSAALAWSLNPNTDTQYAAVGVNRGGGDDLAKVVLTAGNTTATLKVWKFDETGAFTFPDNTVQTTAWTGTTTGAITAESFNTDQITIVGNRISTTVTNANLEIEGNGVGRVVINAIEDATTDSTTRSVGYLGLPPANSSITRTLTIADSGKHTYITAAGVTLTIPAASSVAYPVGTTLTFIAGPSSTSVAIAITTDTMYLAGTGTTGTRTLAAHGMATAVKVSGTSSAGVWYINGTGLT